RPGSSITYHVNVLDINNCSGTASVNIPVQEPPDISQLKDTAVIIGQAGMLNGYAGQGFKYQWSPETGLNCTNCFNPVATPLIPITYTVIATDTNGCFKKTAQAFIDVRDTITVDVPNAFSPNGDGINDIIYVKGWGIKRLISFKIYNRWGQLVFETSDINTG